MSRSIPSSRVFLRGPARSYPRQELSEAFRQALREFGSKKRVKRAVCEERAIAPGARHPVDPDAVPVRVFDEGPFVHYPASPADIRNVIRLLPPGLLDGLESISCSLGEFEQPPPASDDDDGPTPDPLVGRVGYEELPGVYVGETLALQASSAGRARIWVHAYVYDPEQIECRAWEVALRAEMLASLCHEIAHHDDRTRRFSRGRWFMARKPLNERYARRMERAWADRYVLPYIRDVYPAEVAELRSWFLDQPTERLVSILHPSNWCSFCRTLFSLARHPRRV